MTEEGAGDEVMVKLLTKTSKLLISDLRKQSKNVYILTSKCRSDRHQMMDKLILY